MAGEDRRIPEERRTETVDLGLPSDAELNPGVNFSTARSRPDPQPSHRDIYGLSPKPRIFPKDCYDRAKAEFKKKNYQSAVDWYGKAIREDPANVDYLCDRSHAHIKLDEFEKAKADANKAIEIAINDETGPQKRSISKAYFRSGIASFNLGQYSEAKKCFINVDPESADATGIQQWITWCDEKMVRLGIKWDGDASPRTIDLKEPTNSEIATNREHITATSTDYKLYEEKETLQISPPTIKHDWYQTEGQVVIEVRIKGLKQEEVSIDFGSTSISLTAQLPTSSNTAERCTDYSLKLDLAHPVIPSQCTYIVMSNKLEIKLKKQEGIRWANLEGSGHTPIIAPIPAEVLNPQQQPTSLSARGKNWDRIAVDIEKELANDKPEGEAALNEAFQKIYANADDNTKRAMNKSFQESGGTVLSTDWNKIGQTRTEVKPPDGMEWKNWDQ